MPIQTETIVTHQAEPVAIQSPSQLALDNITETMAALLDEAKALTGADSRQTTLIVSDVPAAVWHAFPQPAIHAGDRPFRHIWKHIARSGSSYIAAFCEHGPACPDLPKDEQS